MVPDCSGRKLDPLFTRAFATVVIRYFDITLDVNVWTARRQLSYGNAWLHPLAVPSNTRRENAGASHR